MSLHLLPLTLGPLLWLCEHARADEIAQYEALRGLAWDAEAVALELYALGGEKFLLVTDAGEPVVAGGWEPRNRGWLRGWMVGTQSGWDRYGVAITRRARRLMESLLADPAVTRLDLAVLAARTRTCRWYMKGLKMRFEGAHRGMGANGETFATYARARGS